MTEVTSFNTRTGDVILLKADVTATGVTYSDLDADQSGAAAAAEAAGLAAFQTINGGTP